MNNREIDWFGYHPKATLLLKMLMLSLLLAISYEIYLRYYLVYNPSFYTGFSVEIGKKLKGKVIHYPYGDIIVNSQGFFDREFSPVKTKKRIAYIGDSICAGVGVGYGYRISEVLAQKLPNYEHMNIGINDSDIGKKRAGSTVKFAVDYQVDKIIYLMNLNDILPDKTVGKDQDVLWIAKYNKWFNWLRGKSYLFTYVRNSIKTYYNQLGFRASGHFAYELFPDKYSNYIDMTVLRINELKNTLNEHNIELIVLILPYEMQVSSEAERKYKEHGIKWEDSFINPGPQAKIIKLFERHKIKYVDGLFAFINANNMQNNRDSIRLGEFYVYNKGDKLDWNHPNREGQRKIADYVHKVGMDKNYFK